MIPRIARVVFVFLAALLVGLAINAIVGPRSVSDLKWDEPDYHSLATRLAESGEYGLANKAAYRAPGFPVLLGLTYWLAGPSVTGGRVLQSLLGACMVALAYVVAHRLAGSLAGCLAALICMLDSFWWRNQWILMQENAAAVMTAIAACLVIVALSSESKWKTPLLILIAGLAFGLLLLTKPILAPLPLLLWLLPLMRGQQRSARAFSLVLLFCIGTLLPLAPWILRNYQRFDRLVPLTTGSGVAFAGAHCPEAFEDLRTRGGWIYKPTYLDSETEARLSRLPSGEREYVADRAAWRAGWTEIEKRSLPDLLLQLALKWLRTVSPSTFFAAGTPLLRIIKIILTTFNAVVLLACAVWILRRRSFWWILLLAAVSLCLTTGLFWGTIRFRYSLAPLIAAFAAASLVVEWRRRARPAPAEKIGSGSGSGPA